MARISILLVEDNEGDIVLTLEALQQSKLNNIIKVVRDGIQAIQFLSREGKYKTESLPDLILLDINLPKVDGKQVLSFIKNHEIYRSIPVIMLTTSTSEKDVMDSYKGHANCYIAKPVDLNLFMEVVRSIESFWFSIVQLPVKK